MGNAQMCTYLVLEEEGSVARSRSWYMSDEVTELGLNRRITKCKYEANE
jgi:hypothetical protein